MKARKQVVVIGAGQGGLSAAIHLRLKGHDVVVVHDGPVGGKAAQIDIAGYRLDPGPSIIILPEIYRQVFRDAGRNPDHYLTFHRLNPISRVYQEGVTGFLDLPDGRQGCIDLIASFSKRDAESFSRLMDDVAAIAPHIEKRFFKAPIHHPWELLNPHLIATATRFDVKKSYRELIDASFESPLLRAFFYGFPSYGGQTYDASSPGALMIPYYMVDQGVFYPEGGVAAIPGAFERLAKELGVEFQVGKVTRITQSNGRASGVHLETGESIEAEAIVANADRLQVHRMLGRTVDVPPSLSYFTVHWGVNRKLEGLTHHNLLIPKDFTSGFEALYRRKQLPEPPIIYLNATSVIDPSTAPPGKTNLFAVVTTPAEEPHIDWQAEEGRYRNVVLDEMAKYGWSLDPGEIEFERIQSPRIFATRDGNYRGTLYGVDEKHRMLGGLFPLGCKDEKVKGLYYCGGSVQPGAGLPMVTLSGRFAANLL